MPTPALVFLLPLAAAPQVVAEEAVLLTNDATREFGQWCGLSGSTALVGDPTNSDAAAPVLKHGAAYVFGRATPPGGWSLLAKLPASDPGGFDRFGYGVGLEGGTAGA